MSITPEPSFISFKKSKSNLSNDVEKQSKKLFRLAPISNQMSFIANRHRVSINNSPYLTPCIGNQQNLKPLSRNSLISPESQKNIIKSNQSLINGQKSKMSIVDENGYSSNSFAQQSGNLMSQNLPDSQKVKYSEQNQLNQNQLEPNINNQNIPNRNHQINQLNESLQQYLARKIKNSLQSIGFQIFITFFTICSLFMEDFRTIFIDKDHDHAADSVNIIFLSIFFIEILMSLTIENYLFSFFFWLDLISTLSICMDITMITDEFYNSGGNSQQLSILITQSKASRAAARAVRIMKIFRLARVVKLYKSALKTRQLNELNQRELIKNKLKLKLQKKKLNQDFNENFQGETSEYKLSFDVNRSMRSKQNIISQKSSTSDLTKQKKAFLNSKNAKIEPIKKKQNTQLQPIDKIYQQQNEQDTQKKSQTECNSGKDKDIVDEDLQSGMSNSFEMSKKQSKISKILSESTIKKIIIVILLIMFSITALDINNYYPDNTSWDFLTDYIVSLLGKPNVPISYINKIIQTNYQSFQNLGIQSQVIVIDTPFNELYQVETMDYNDLRITQIGLSQTQVDLDYILSVRPQLTLSDYSTKNSGTRNLNQFNYVTVILSYKPFNSLDSWFSICKIIFICIIIIYLLQSFNSNIEHLIVTPIQKIHEIIVFPQKKLIQQQEQNNDFKQARYETMIVQKAILKIRGLMSTIFGRIGMDMLYKQLFKADTISAKNYLTTNKKSFAIYGICRIQNFIQISETLQADTFTFINQIAHIVHSAVYRYGGHGVKNLNDGFLVVFKLPEGRQTEIIEQAMKSKVSKQKKNTYMSILCDYCIYSFIKTIVRLQKQPTLLQYKKDQRILQRFGNNFHIQMNFSIGIGESHEGMVGSNFKIDPVYLGGKLDEVNKISLIAQKYPNIIVIEKQVYDNLTVGLKRHCRIMDFVKLNQYDEGNTEIYAVDVDLQYISPSRNKAEKYKKKEDQPDIHVKKQLNMQNLKDNTEIYNYSAQDFINSKKQLREVLRKKISDEMKRKYEIAFRAYCLGQWNDAKYLLEDVMRITKEDVLSKRIYNHMAQKDFKCPDNYCKYRQIKE